jgi:hypothetical protein
MRACPRPIVRGPRRTTMSSPNIPLCGLLLGREAGAARWRFGRPETTASDDLRQSGPAVAEPLDSAGQAEERPVVAALERRQQQSGAPRLT